MMAFKNQRAIEAKVHSQLYTNISLLTHIYTPTKEFLAVFQKDMFVKNNSAAFQQVVYYLLNVLNPERLRQKVKNWPVYDGRSETQFRGEVVKYLNELSGSYEDAGLPSILMSHIIAPGGLRFAKYMLKLSQLVLYEHLKRTEDSPHEMLDRIHSNKNIARTEASISKIRLVTKHLNINNRKAICDFFSRVEEYKKEGCEMYEKLRLNLKQIPELKQKLLDLQLNMKNNSVSSDNMLDTNNEMLALKEKAESIRILNEKFDKITDLLNSLLKQDLIFTYKPGMYSSVINDSSSELNLLYLFEKLNHILQNKCLELDVVTEEELESNIKKFETINDGLQKKVHDLKKVHENLSKLSCQLENMKKQESKPAPKAKIRLMESQLPRTASSEEVLAVPLEITEQSSLGILSFDD